MRLFLRVETLFLSLYIYFYIFEFSLMYFFLLFFVPDVSMFGYLFNTKVGAYSYNSIHNLVLPVVMFIIGSYFNIGLVKMLSLILFSHIFMDRILGYGLKYNGSFKHTHL